MGLIDFVYVSCYDHTHSTIDGHVTTDRSIEATIWCDVFRDDIPELVLVGTGDKFMTVWDELWNRHDSVTYVGRFAYSMRAYIY